MNVKYCINCSNFFIGNGSKCAKCGSSTNESYAKLIVYAHEMVFYGYIYRTAYEKLLQDKKVINEKYSIVSPDSLFDVFAIAVLGGVVGNASYDVLKSIVRKTKTVFKNKEIDKRLKKLLDSEREFKKFVECLKDYHNDVDIPKPILKAINEEKLAHQVAKKIKDGKNISKNMLSKILREAINEVKKNKKPDKKILLSIIYKEK